MERGPETQDVDKETIPPSPMEGRTKVPRFNDIAMHPSIIVITHSAIAVHGLRIHDGAQHIVRTRHEPPRLVLQLTRRLLDVLQQALPQWLGWQRLLVVRALLGLGRQVGGDLVQSAVGW